MTKADVLRKQHRHYRQPYAAFIDAGRGAYRMVIPLQNNPYSEQPWRDLWDKGYRLERRKAEGPRPHEGVHTRRPEAAKPTTPRRPYQGRAHNVQHTYRPGPAAPYAEQSVTPVPERPVITLGRIARFNAKYRTTV